MVQDHYVWLTHLEKKTYFHGVKTYIFNFVFYGYNLLLVRIVNK